MHDLEPGLARRHWFIPRGNAAAHEVKLRPRMSSARLQTFGRAEVARTGDANSNPAGGDRWHGDVAENFTAAELKERAARLSAGIAAIPFGWSEWLEEAGLRARSPGDAKRRIAMLGGIVDIFRPRVPWPVAFGNSLCGQLERLREFDPLTHISRGEICQSDARTRRWLGT